MLTLSETDVRLQDVVHPHLRRVEIRPERKGGRIIPTP
jgi:hypothetical protein